VEKGDKKAFKIFTNIDYGLPIMLPDGLYNPGQVEIGNKNSWLISELKNSTSLTGQLEDLVIPARRKDDREILL